MRDVVIRAEGLGKKYVIGHQSSERERYTALRDVIARQMRGLGRSAMDIIRGRPNIAGDEIEDFWALRHIDFEIQRGDVVGIIGRNGAGKSTLLKVLSRITEPSEGRVTIKERVASLLEVGTGFHPELTGRENIYLNGAILGMTRKEIRSKFDEIIDFAGVEKFLDTPVKRYSSGMYVRLAFSVAAHLEPEILVIDEVLAVGDAEFQKKCLGKMRDVAEGGRTVLFVSHNLALIERVCERTLLLELGRIEAFDETKRTISQYRRAREQNYRFKYIANRTKEDKPFIRQIYVQNSHKESLLKTLDDAFFYIDIYSPEQIADIGITIYISTNNHQLLSLMSNRPDNKQSIDLVKGINRIECRIDKLVLAAGRYQIGAGLHIPNVEWFENEQYLFDIDVDPTDVYGSGLAPAAERYHVVMDHNWQNMSV